MICRRLEAEELRLLRDESRAALAEVEQQLVALHERKADAEKVERALDEKARTICTLK